MRIITSIMLGLLSAGLLVSFGAYAEKAMRIDVTSTGAVPNDGNDDTMAVLAAFEKCKAVKASGVVFPKGQYHFKAGTNPAIPHMSLPMDGMSDVVIDGQGSELIFDGITSCFGFSNCDHVTVKNFIIDWARPTFSVGKIVGGGEDWFDVEVFEEFPVKGGEPVQAFMDYEPDTGLPCRYGHDVYCLEKNMTTELLAPQKLRVKVPFKITPVTPGKLAVLRHQVYGYNAFATNKCRNMTFRDLTVYTCPGMGFIGINSETITLERCRVMPKPGTRRLISATADGSHFGGCRGDILIKDCLFDGQGDDAINMKSGLFLTIQEKVDSQTVLARHNLGFQTLTEPNDILELMPQETFLTYGTARVKSVTTEPDGKTYRITMDAPLPEEMKVGHLLANATSLPRARIKHCTFQRNRARGMLIQVRDSVVEDCTFRDITAAGVLIISEAVYFYESIPAHHVTIRRNRFEHCDYGAGMAQGVICAVGIAPKWKLVETPGVFRDVTIEKNVIERSDNSGIFLTGVEDAVVRGNTIKGVCDKPMEDRTTAAVYLQGCRNVTLSGNTVEQADQGAQCRTVFQLGPGNDTATIKTEGNKGF